MNKDTLLENLGSILETLIEKKVNEKFEEICGKELKETSFLNSTLDRDELCERWGCCKNTLGNLEKNGCLHSIPVHGKKKMYLMSDIINIDNRGGWRSLTRKTA